MLYSEWDEEKANRNLLKHGIGFEEASAVFDDPFHLVSENVGFEGEQRFQAIGSAGSNIVIHVTYVDRLEGSDIVARIISARKATPRERRSYEQIRKTSSGNTA